MKPKVFIDGSWGTTGLKISEKLQNHKDIELVSIAEQYKKSPQKKLAIIKQCDLVILCLPDEEARKTAQFVSDFGVKIIDASSVHRISNDWCYGFPELSKEQRNFIQKSNKVANVGCYAVASIALLRPLLSQKILKKKLPLTIHAISGYSGGGKKLIAEYKAQKLPTQTYGLDQKHKHIPEIMKYSTLEQQPYFAPSVGDFAQGMIVHIPLFSSSLIAKNTIKNIYDCYKNYYKNEKFIQIASINSQEFQQDGFLNPTICNGSNHLKIGIFGNEKIFSVVAILDNLGKGASGSAIQNLNLMLGFDEITKL